MAGNGVALLPHVAAERADPGVLDRLRRELDGAQGRTVLYSSETLYRSRPERLAEVVETARTAGFDVRAVGFVRDIAGHALSVYSQNVRAGHCRLTFTEYVRGDGMPRYRLHYRRRLESMLALFGEDRVRMMHYDSERSDLIGAFLQQELGLDGTLIERPQRDVNRSLTRTELAFMRYANTLLHDKPSARKVSDLLLSQPPAGTEDPCISRGELEVLQSTVGDDVDWMNERFLGGRLRVEGGAEVTADAAATPSLTPKQEESVRRLVATALS